jgi:hypothetical protein
VILNSRSDWRELRRIHDAPEGILQQDQQAAVHNKWWQFIQLIASSNMK